MKTAFVARECYQVLLSGTWDSDDCNWDWEIKDHEFPTCKDAIKYINSLNITDDMPIVKLLKRVYTIRQEEDDEWVDFDDIYLDERINADPIVYRKEVQ